MITHVLVPVDGSELSLRAVPVAGALARLTGATVDLLSVEPVGPSRTIVQEQLDEAAALVPHGVGTSTTVVTTTESVVDTLAHLEHPTGTILCLATHGRGPLASLGLGSLTANLVARAEMPVLVVGPCCTSHSPRDLEGSAVAAIDGSARDDAVLRAATEWTRATRVPLVLTTTVTRPSEPDAWTDAHDALTDAQGIAADLGVDAELLPVAATDVDEGVLRAVDHRTGCVVMGSHRRGRLGRLVFGSTTAAVVHRAPCPVLVAAPAPHDGGG